MISKSFLAVFFAAMTMLVSCSHICTYGTPDISAFNQFVLSQSLRDSLSHNTLTIGMPYSVVRMLFSGCGSDTSIQVAASGHRQELLETEGLYKTFQDPNIQMYLNKYKTSQGDLYIWYGNMNFYKAGISKNDSVVLYSVSKINSAHITSLLTSQKFHTDSVLIKNTIIPFAEIHSRENIGNITYWYDLKVIDSVTVKQETQATSQYPILHMELGTTPITSFHWR